MQRRIVVKSLAAMTMAPIAGTALAQNRLPRTGRDAEGPYYPTEPIPLNNDLLVSDRHAGDKLTFSGRVLHDNATPVADARVEIWQCDGNSIYRHPRAPHPERADMAFRGFGATLTNASGEFFFRTIVPVPYPGRPPHIHTMIWVDGSQRLTTQVYLEGHGGLQRRALSLAPVAESRFTASFDFVI